MKKIDRRSFLKVLGIAGAACAMTALTGCDDGVSVPSDGSTPLSYLKPLNGEIAWGNYTPEDPFGQIYTQGANYSIFTFYANKWKNTYNEKNTYGDGDNHCASVEYLTDRKYRKLTMNLNPYKDMGEEGCGFVRIYADDKLVAVSEMIGQKTRQTVKLEADITGAEYIKVVPAVVRDYGWDKYRGSIILWDVKLWK